LIPIVDLQGAAIAMAVSNAIVLIMRVINSRSILKFEINWICSLSSISLLICQAVLVTVQLEHFMLLSLFATLLIICIEVTDLVPAGKAAMQLIHKQKIDFQVNAHNKRKK
jgi:O-antigen/teichoic acid export membrane protein